MDWQSHQAMILASHRSHACILPVYLWMPQTVKIFVCRWYLPSSLTSDKAQTRRSPPSFPSLHRPVTSFFPFLAVSSKCLVFSRHIVTLFLSLSLYLYSYTRFSEHTQLHLYATRIFVKAFLGFSLSLSLTRALSSLHRDLSFCSVFVICHILAEDQLRYLSPCPVCGF